MKPGIAKKDWIILNKLALEPLQNKKAKIFAFGSRVRGDYHPFSDLDLLIKEDPNFPIDDHFYAHIQENLENSNLTIKVDIVKDKQMAASYRNSIEAFLLDLNTD